jgi:hypothetical protein
MFLSKAVTTALQVLYTQHAVEFFEQGMSITHQQSMQLKLPNDYLMSHLPLQSERLIQISTFLHSSMRTTDSNINYHLLAHEHQQLIVQIHTYPGFNNFLLPLKYSNLCLAAKNGPIIMLNHMKTHTDAIIILAPSVPPFHLPLMNVSTSDINEQRETMKHALLKLSMYSRNTHSQNNIDPHNYATSQDALHGVNI